MMIIGSKSVSMVIFIGLWLPSCQAGAFDCSKDLARLTKIHATADEEARNSGLAMSEGQGEPTQEAKELVKRVDAQSRLFIKAALLHCGWPKRTKFGMDMVSEFSQLIIHAEDDRALQKQALRLMAKALPKHDADGQDFALLTDKILTNENRPQRYGTQLDWAFNVKELENPAEVDARRATLGMMPLNE